MLQGGREYVPAHAVCSAEDDTALGGESQKEEKNGDKQVEGETEQESEGEHEHGAGRGVAGRRKRGT